MATQRNHLHAASKTTQQESSWRQRGAMFLVQRLVMALVLAPVLPIATPSADAAVHGSCNTCGQLVVLSESGAGFRRHWQGRCGKCKESLMDGLKEFTRPGETAIDTLDRMSRESFDLDTQGKTSFNGYRYLNFADGTRIDLRHFVVAAETAVDAHSEVVANLFGWGWELLQWKDGNSSGRPFGGNEDLRSNSAGADFGDDYISATGGTLGEQMMDYLEGQHGPLTYYSYWSE